MEWLFCCTYREHRERQVYSKDQVNEDYQNCRELAAGSPALKDGHPKACSATPIRLVQMKAKREQEVEEG